MLQDFALALRLLRKSPGFAAVAILALALGIGANTAIFTALDTVLLRPLPYPNPDQVVRIFDAEPQCSACPVTGPNFLDWKERNHTFQYLAAYAPRNLNLTGIEPPERLKAGAVTAEMFPLLGVQPLLGRWFLPEEDRPGQNRVVILSYGAWQRLFGSDRGLIGRKLVANGEPHTVVGVMPPGFRFPRGLAGDPDAYVPMALVRNEALRSNHNMHAAARLKPGVTLAQARAGMEAIARQLKQEHPATNTGIDARVIRYSDDLTGFMRKPLAILYGAVGFVLLIACANVTNLLMTRAAARRREIAVRTALGAGRFRIARLMLAESLTLALAGGTLGLLLALWGVDLLVHVKGIWIPRIKDAAVDWRILSYNFGLSALTGLLFGMLPAMQSARRGLAHALSEGSERAGSSRSSQRARDLLVAAEVALALVLLIGAGVMARSFLRVLRIDPGFRPENVLTMRMQLPVQKFRDERQALVFLKRVLEGVRAVPGVRSAGTTQKLPLAGGWNGPIVIEGRSYSDIDHQGPLVEHSEVLPGYLETMGIRLLAGRRFTEADLGQDARVAIVNQTCARLFWPNEDPVGKRLSYSRRPPVWLQVVGVVGDARQGLTDKVMPEVYTPDFEAGFLILTIGTGGDPQSVVGAVRRKILDIDKDQPVFEIRTMEQMLSDAAGSERFYTQVLGIFAAVALLLAAIGVYGVMAYSVSRRTHELGIRVALGAGRGDVVRMVIWQALRVIALGLAAGLAGALALTRFLRSLVYETSVTDAATYVSVSVFLLLVALAASYLPARRATAVDPAVALRHE